MFENLATVQAEADDSRGFLAYKGPERRAATFSPGSAATVASGDLGLSLFNDEHGHDTGDDALRIVAGVLRTLRGGTAYRQGGEEFVAILPGASLEEAHDALEELRAAIEATPLLLRARKRLRVTASIGVAARSASQDGARTVLRAADQALLRAKRLGRNRVEASRSRVTAPARSSRTALARRAGDARTAPRRAAARGR